MRFVVLYLALMFLSSCDILRSTKIPLPAVVIQNEPSNTSLVIFLPGRNSDPEDFEGKFTQAVRDLKLPVDLMAVDAHLGYYMNRSIVNRLKEDVISSAQLAKYNNIWLVGTSLGGLGALLYLRDRPQDISGILVIAPYLGEEDVIEEIEEAGGINKWQPPGSIAPNDVGRKLWSWLLRDGITKNRDSIFIGWGKQDSFARSNKLLSSLLPANHSIEVEGDHSMLTFATIWERFLEQNRNDSFLDTQKSGFKKYDSN